MKALSRPELEELQIWFDESGSKLPVSIQDRLKRLFAVYLNLVQSASRARATLTTLRQAMGFVPKSERGRGQKSSETQIFAATQEPSDSTEREIYEGIKRKRDELAAQKAEYDRKLRDLPKVKAQESAQMEFDLARSCEMLFSYPSGHRKCHAEKQRVERMREFGKTTGLHSATDKTKRIEFQVVVTDITYEVETVTDPETGKSVRASMADVGPEKFQYTWGAIANLIKLHVGFAIPINRLVLIIGQPEFTSSKICRVLQYVAMNLLPIYLYLAEELSDSEILSGDDTSTKVLNLDAEESDSLSQEIDTHLGWRSNRADGSGEKKAVNVSLLVGRKEKDPRATVRFFRTHVGSVGNLLSRLLEWRNPKAGSLTFQGDLSSANMPSAELQKRFNLAVAGCGAHARRPFWRFRDQDESLCYYMLRGFLLLSQIEHMIDAKGRTRANVLKLRGRYARWVWHAMRNRCMAAITGLVPSAGTYPKGITPDVWPPGHELNRAAQYVVNHIEELTLYLDQPLLQYTNNGVERALRIEKCMLSSSKFRKTRNGRAVLDILRTINATCTAAEIDVTDYLRYVFKHLDQLHDHPERYTPYAVACERAQPTKC